MIKKSILLILLILSLTVCAAFGETLPEVPETEEYVPETAETTAEDAAEEAPAVQLVPVLSFMPKLTVVAGTNYIISTEKSTHYQSVLNTAGDKLATFPFTSLSYSNYNFFTAWSEDGINTRALVHLNGAQVTEPTYGAFTVYNKNWVLAYVLNPADEETSTYKRGKEFFTIDHYDLYYVEDDAASTTPIGTLQPDAFKSAAVHGDFIAIMNQADQVALYDKTFQLLDYPMEKTSTPVYGVSEYAIVNRVTGEMVADGYTAVSERPVNVGLWLITTRFDFRGKKLYSVIDLQGNELMSPTEYVIGTMTNHYAVVSGEDKLKGLYSIDEGRLIVPCEFFNIMIGKVSTDNYVHHGYVAVEDGDLRGYYDVAAGRLSCEIKYNRTEVTTVGCSTFWKVEDGLYMLAAADGVETEVHVDEILANNRGDGYWLVAKRDGLFGVIDWHGNEVLPFEHNKAITITDDSQAIIRTSTGMQLDRIVR